MNVLIVYPHGNALNPQSGGEMKAWIQSVYLIRNKFNVFILHSKKSKNFEDKELKKKCKVYYYKDFNFHGISDWYFSDFNPFYLLKLFRIIRKNKIDVIQIEFPWGLLAAKLFAKKKTFLIYNSYGIESEFIKVAINNPSFPKFFKPLAQKYTKFYERLACKFADIIINVSEKERDYYVKNYNIKKNKTILIQVPSSITTTLSRSEEIKIQCRAKLKLPQSKIIAIFHGGLRHPPNKEAFDLIKSNIAPRINNPNLIFVMAGSALEKFEKENMISLGFVDDLKDLLYAADFAIVPIISGSGMRVKCSDYIVSALPFISTKKGIEGIDFLKAGEDYLETNNVDNDFITHIESLSNNEKLRHQMSQNLLKKSEKLHRDEFERKYIKFYEFLKKNDIQ